MEYLCLHPLVACQSVLLGRRSHSDRAEERKARAENALHGTRAAVEEGVVPGGGVALIRVLKAPEKLEGGREEQLRRIVEDAGENAGFLLSGVKVGKGAYGDMLEESIFDPAKVTRLGLQNASSVATLLLTTEVMIAEAPKGADHHHGPPGGGIGGMGGTGM